eukprot:765865-Hanusia_phi.AAC.2
MEGFAEMHRFRPAAKEIQCSKDQLCIISRKETFSIWGWRFTFFSASFVARQVEEVSRHMTRDRRRLSEVSFFGRDYRIQVFSDSPRAGWSMTQGLRRAHLGK